MAVRQDWGALALDPLVLGPFQFALVLAAMVPHHQL